MNLTRDDHQFDVGLLDRVLQNAQWASFDSIAGDPDHEKVSGSLIKWHLYWKSGVRVSDDGHEGALSPLEFLVISGAQQTLAGRIARRESSVLFFESL